MRKYVINTGASSKKKPPSQSARLLEKRPQQQQSFLPKRSPLSSPAGVHGMPNSSPSDGSSLEHHNQSPSTISNNKNQTPSEVQHIIRYQDFWDDGGPFSEKKCFFSTTQEDDIPSAISSSILDITSQPDGVAGIPKQKGFLNLNLQDSDSSSDDYGGNQSESRSSLVSYSTSDDGSNSSC